MARDKSTIDSIMETVEEYTGKDTVIGDVFNALQKPQGLSMVSSANLIEALGGDVKAEIPTVKQIVSGEKEFLPSQAFNITNPALAFPADVMLDPLFLINPMKWLKVAKTLASTGKAGSTALKAVKAYDKLGKVGKSAIKLGAIGGGVGLLAADKPSEIVPSVLKYGSGLGIAAPALGIAKEAGTVGNALVDAVQAKIHPEVFKKATMPFSEASDIVKKGRDKFDEITRGVKTRDYEAGLYDISDAESAKLADVGDMAWEDTIDFRNDLISDRLKYRLDIKDIDMPKNSLGYQLPRAGKAKFGDRVILNPVGDTFEKYTAKGGSNNFVKDAKMYGSVDDAVGKGAQDKLVKSFNDIDAISAGAKDRGGLMSTVIDQKELNKMTALTNTHVGRKVMAKLGQIGDKKLTRNVNSFVQRNRDMITDYNVAMKAKHGKDFVDLVPIDFHTFEVSAMENLDDIYKNVDPSNIKTGLVKRSKSGKIETGGLNFKERMQLEAERYPLYFMNKAEREARKIVNGVKYGKVDEANPLKYLTKAVDGLDSFTNFLKQQQLTFSQSWVLNNFSENTVRAYMNNGLEGVMKSGADLIDGKKFKELIKLTDPNEGILRGINVNDNLFKAGINSGAVSEGFFGEAFRKGHLSKPMLIAKVGSKEATRMIDDVASAGNAKKLYRSYQDMLKNTVGRTGQLVENSARMSTFDSVISKIIGSPDELKKLGTNMSEDKLKKLIYSGDYYKDIRKYPELRRIYDKATKVVNDTFFNYGNTTAFEDKVMKRMFPYWTFFSKNMGYWADNIVNNAGRTRQLVRTSSLLGAKPSKNQRKEIPDYLLERGARLSRGGKVLTVPNISIFDFMNTLPSNIRGTTLDRAHPVLKLAKNLIQETDDFGNELFPSKTKSGRSRVFGSALKYEPFTSAIYRDPKTKKAYTDSDMFQLFNQVQQALLPVPLIDTGVRIAEDVRVKDSIDSIVNAVSPVKVKTLSKEDRLKARRARQSEEKRMIRNLIRNARSR